jgi:diguanylate cyclase (GGDEF)-like protein
MSAGGVIWLLGQAAGYLLTRNDVLPFDPGVETFPLMVALPVAATGIVGVAWPAKMNRDDRHRAVLDIALGISALFVIWSLALVPRWVMPTDPRQASVSRVDQWVLLFAISIVLAFLVLNRKRGGLPLAQMLLLFGALIVLFISDVAGEFGSDRLQHITVSIIGYWIATCMFVAMMHRSPAEVEGLRQEEQRELIAFLTPMLLMAVAGLIVVNLAAASRPDSLLLKVAPVVWLLGFLAVGITSIALLRRLRAHTERTMSDDLTLSAEQGWIKALLQDTSSFAFVLNRAGATVYASPSTTAMFGASPDFTALVIAPSPSDLQALLAGVPRQATPPGPHEMLLDSPSGQRELQVHIRPVRDVDFDGFVITGEDVTETRLLEARVVSTGQRDQLTGLLSGPGLLAELTDRLITIEAPNALGVALLDISDFGAWNDSLGRQAGDEILRVVAGKLDSMPERVKAAARYGGDSFGFIIEDERPIHSMETCLQRLSEHLRGVILDDGTEIDLRFRAGYTATDREVKRPSAQELVERADIALRRSRHSRQSARVAYRPGMNEDLIRRLTAERAVQHALADDGLLVYYQPIVSLNDGEVRRVEALVRIRTIDGEILSPAEFLEAAEHGGHLRAVDRRVREIAASDWSAIAAVTDETLRINLNVSDHDLDADLVAEMTPEVAGHFTIEVVESAVLAHPEQAYEVLSAIRSAGAQVAIDDFGTGYSSMSHIAGLPCDILKIDRNFVSAMQDSRKSLGLVRAMVQLAHDLGLKAVAEGVENAEQEATLRALGCDRVQGFHYSRPVPLDDLLPWLSQRQELSSSRAR